MELVSVIIATKNSEAYLEQALRSIVDNGYRPIEVIMVDASSTDRTLEIAKEFPEVRVINQDGLGLYPAWNEGLLAAKGEYIAFLDSDDYWVKGKLEKSITQFEMNSKLAYLIAHFKYQLDDGQEIPPGFREELLGQTLLGRIPGTLVARKTTFDEVGLFSTELDIAGDVDWFARAKDAAIPMEILTDVFLYKRLHSGALTTQAQLNTEELLKVLGSSIARRKRKKEDS